MSPHRVTIRLTGLVLTACAFVVSTGCGFEILPVPCGGPDGTHCAIGSFCRTADGDCDDEQALGVCTEIPFACTLEYAPVCGCDGQTYGNACGASAAGVNVAIQGECVDGDS